MDTLSSSVSSSFTLPAASRRKSVDIFRHLKTTSIHNNTIPTSASSSFHLPPRRNSFSNFTTTNLEFFTGAAVPSNRISPVKPHPQAAAIHRRAASGYAAALVDIAKRNESLDAVRRDVRRVWKWTRNEHLSAALIDPLVDNNKKGEILKEIAEKGKIHKLLGALLKILAGKNRAELLSEVLMEFERIYDEIYGTARVVLLSAAKKNSEDKETAALEVAKTVHQISGAWKVKIDSGIQCEPCGGKGWLLCDFCKGQKTNVQSETNKKIYRRCPSCRAIGYLVCSKCKVFKCVTYPNAGDGQEP